MTGLELLEKYPKAAKVIAEFYNNKLIESMDADQITEEFKQIIKSQEFDNQYIATFIDSNPRFLFDVFDANEIYITTTVSEVDGYFMWHIRTEKEDFNDIEYLDNRKMAEVGAIEKAFEILNDKL